MVFPDVRTKKYIEIRTNARVRWAECVQYVPILYEDVYIPLKDFSTVVAPDGAISSFMSSCASQLVPVTRRSAPFQVALALLFHSPPRFSSPPEFSESF